MRLDPEYLAAHNDLGNGLYTRGDLDGAIVEYREALTLNSNYSYAHYNLGLALEKKSDRRGALEEYRAAYTLNPKEPVFKSANERLLQAVK